MAEGKETHNLQIGEPPPYYCPLVLTNDDSYDSMMTYDNLDEKSCSQLPILVKRSTMRIGAFVLLAVVLVASPVLGQDCAADGTCDKHERCPVWSGDGECFRNKEYMAKYCPVSCETVDITPAGDCQDSHPRCATWASVGECVGNVAMKNYCAESCKTCDDTSNPLDKPCVDKNENCELWASGGECRKNPRFMLKHCALSCDSCEALGKNSHIKSPTIKNPSGRLKDGYAILEDSEEFGVRQRAEGAELESTLGVIIASTDYVNSDEFSSLPSSVRENCRNKHDLCSFWAVIGECKKNLSYMTSNCAPACRICDLIDMEKRCPALTSAVPALKAGDLNKMFERIVTEAPGNTTLSAVEREKLGEEGMPEYTVQVLSRPSEEPASEISAINDKTLPPWAIVFDNFITPEECEGMIELGREAGYVRSRDVGKKNFDGTVSGKESEGRTSENAWCSVRNGCRKSDLATTLHNRISKVLEIPVENSEDFQLLRYEEGQFYNTHHDYIPHQKDRQCGPRILTFFMYLSDVEEGGGTDFPDLGFTVQPKRGRAVLWPSVLDSSPFSSDPRMRHQALPVKAGTKYGANAWVHMYDYVGPQARGCS